MICERETHIHVRQVVGPFESWDAAVAWTLEDAQLVFYDSTIPHRVVPPSEIGDASIMAEILRS